MDEDTGLIKLITLPKFPYFVSLESEFNPGLSDSKSAAFAALPRLPLSVPGG